jgi:hypothetical protein
MKAQLGRGRFVEGYTSGPLYYIASHIPTRSFLGRLGGARRSDRVTSVLNNFPFVLFLLLYFSKKDYTHSASIPSFQQHTLLGSCCYGKRSFFGCHEICRIQIGRIWENG